MQALRNAARFMKEAGAHAVKLEGGERVLPQVEPLVAAGIPVMAHLGLTPQSVNAFGGYRVQGRGEEGERLLRDAKALQDAGAFARRARMRAGRARRAGHRTRCRIPTIGIGAGPGTDAQVLVWQDMAGLTPQTAEVRQAVRGRAPGCCADAAEEYADDVVGGAFPAAEHAYR